MQNNLLLHANSQCVCLHMMDWYQRQLQLLCQLHCMITACLQQNDFRQLHELFTCKQPLRPGPTVTEIADSYKGYVNDNTSVHVVLPEVGSGCSVRCPSGPAAWLGEERRLGVVLCRQTYTCSQSTNVTASPMVPTRHGSITHTAFSSR